MQLLKSAEAFRPQGVQISTSKPQTKINPPGEGFTPSLPFPVPSARSAFPGLECLPPPPMSIKNLFNFRMRFLMCFSNFGAKNMSFLDQKSYFFATFWQHGSRMDFLHDFHHFLKAPTFEKHRKTNGFSMFLTFALVCFEGKKNIKK